MPSFETADTICDFCKHYWEPSVIKEYRKKGVKIFEKLFTFNQYGRKYKLVRCINCRGDAEDKDNLRETKRDKKHFTDDS